MDKRFSFLPEDSPMMNFSNIGRGGNFTIPVGSVNLCKHCNKNPAEIEEDSNLGPGPWCKPCWNLAGELYYFDGIEKFDVTRRSGFYD